jgi:F0F1-type ATP synthase assembly protein I
VTGAGGCDGAGTEEVEVPNGAVDGTIVGLARVIGWFADPPPATHPVMVIVAILGEPPAVTGFCGAVEGVLVCADADVAQKRAIP